MHSFDVAGPFTARVFQQRLKYLPLKEHLENFYQTLFVLISQNALESEKLNPYLKDSIFEIHRCVSLPHTVVRHNKRYKITSKFLEIRVRT